MASGSTSSDSALEYSAAHDDLRSLLSGKGLVRTADCPVDIPSNEDEVFYPVTKRNVCYIVAGVVFNEAGEILFMQEAKASCRGKWYLPAGRMEPNETIEEAVKREVHEETGLEIEPETLLCMEASVRWYRFTFTGCVTGGTLKSPAEADKESLQARWMSMEDLKNKKYPLRAKDVLKLVAVAEDYRSKPPQARHPSLLPVITGHEQLLLRVVIAHQSGDDVYVMTKNRDLPHFPSMVLSEFSYRIIGHFREVLRESLGTLADRPNCDVIGILALEHHGKPEAVHDGFAVTLLLSFPNNGILPKISETARGIYSWHQIDDVQLKDDLVTRLAPGMCAALILL